MAGRRETPTLSTENRIYNIFIHLQTTAELLNMATQTELIQPQLHPKELSFPVPKALHTTAHVHLTSLETCVMVFVTASTPGESSGPVKPMGSFVYAMPDVSLL